MVQIVIASLDITGDLRIGSIDSINSNELIISNQILLVKIRIKTPSVLLLKQK